MRVKIILFVSICSMISFVFTSDLGAEVYDDFNGSEINPDLWYTDNNASGLLYQSGGFLIAESPPYSSFGCIDSKIILYGDFEVILPWSSVVVIEGCQHHFSLNISDAYNPNYINEAFIYISHDLSPGEEPYPHVVIASCIVVDGTQVDDDFLSFSVDSVSGLFKITRVGSTVNVFYDIGSGWVLLNTASNAFTCPVIFSIYAQTGLSGLSYVGSDWIEIYASPKASFKYSPLEPMVGGKIEFDASDSEGNIVDYEWDWDDGQSGSGPEPWHMFKEPGIYDVNLTVTDENGLKDSNEVKLDLSLKNGDLLLSRCRKNPLGALGILFWTHVGIYHQPSNMVVEARANPDWVVASYPLSDWFYDEKTCVEVLRVKTDQPIRDAAVVFAKSKINHKYDFYSPFANLKQDGDDLTLPGVAWYCSELVWAAYLSASNGQINLDPDNHAVSPDEINNSNHTIFHGAHMEEIPNTVGIRYFWGQVDCPVDLEITDPDGLVLNKQGSQIPEAVYQEFDIDEDDDLDDFFAIPEPKDGDYLIHVIPDPDALPTDTFTLVVNRNGTVRVLAQDVQVQDIPETPYIVTDLVGISADVEIEPESLNLSSEGNWITCYIELPEGHDVGDIDVDSILLEGLLEVEHSDVQDSALMVKFSKQDLIIYLESVLGVIPPDEVTLTLTGELTDETPFEGSDTIRVIKTGGEKK